MFEKYLLSRKLLLKTESGLGLKSHYRKKVKRG